MVSLLPDRAAFYESFYPWLVQQSRAERHGPGAALSTAEQSGKRAATWTFRIHEAGAGLGARRSCAASFLPQMDARALL